MPRQMGTACVILLVTPPTRQRPRVLLRRAVRFCESPINYAAASPRPAGQGTHGGRARETDHQSTGRRELSVVRSGVYTVPACRMGGASSSSSSSSSSTKKRLKAKRALGYEDPAVLAAQTSFTVNEVEALYELYKDLSFSIFKDGLIHKEEFRLALFRNTKGSNLFADRVFDMFDLKRNGVIDFGEFVRSLSIFHPKASESEKTKFAFKLYDLRGTGYIDKEELKEMVLALFGESDLCLSDSAVEEIVDNTFKQADSNGDGRIDPKEWEEFVRKNPTSLRNMSLPYLKDITTSFPSFVMHSEVED